MSSLEPAGLKGPYCDLVLYVGRCHADGLPPGRFPAAHGDPYSAKRMSNALRTIERYLRPAQRWGLIVDYRSLVSSNAEADRLAQHALQRFAGAKEILEPHQCIHGKILFSRKIRLPGYSEEDAAAIVRVMRESGHLPNEFVLKAERARKLYPSEDRASAEIRKLEEEIGRIWRAALKFYIGPG